jgi:hypothetical protein
MLKMLTSYCQMKIRRDSLSRLLCPQRTCHDVDLSLWDGRFSDHTSYPELALVSGGRYAFRFSCGGSVEVWRK